MSCPVLGASSISAACASAAMSMLTMKTEQNYHVLGFSSKLVPIGINPQMRLDDVMRKISSVCNDVWNVIQMLQYHVCILHDRTKANSVNLYISNMGKPLNIVPGLQGGVLYVHHFNTQISPPPDSYINEQTMHVCMLANSSSVTAY